MPERREEPCVGLRAVSAVVSYGWSMIPVKAAIGGSVFEISLFPKNGGYVVPIKDLVRHAERLGDGDAVRVELAIRS